MSEYDYLFGDIKIIRADRQPCIVCGHPTGDCAPENHPEHIRVFGIGIFPSLDKDQTFTVMEDVYEERQVAPRQTIKARLFKKGQIIPLSTAREYGLTDQ